MTKIRAAFLLLFLLLSLSLLRAQTGKPVIYDPGADARAEISKMVEAAHAGGKHVLLQVGGNW